MQNAVLEHVAGHVPVIVTTTHFSSDVCAARGRAAQDAGGATAMIMPPCHDATIRVPEHGIHEFYRRVSDAIDIPIMIRNAPVSGTTLRAAFPARLAHETGNVSYFKIECPQAAAKLREPSTRAAGAQQSTATGEGRTRVSSQVIAPICHGTNSFCP